MRDANNHIIEGCKRQERKAQNDLWKMYAPKMMSICRRYIKQQDIAEDVLLTAFSKIFAKIEGYKGSGSFEGWIKRIVINECLMEIRRRHAQHFTLAMDEVYDEPSYIEADQLQYQELVALLDDLPDGYRTVFNLYAIEGYKHREIAEELGISINTSKSQLILARRKLQGLLKKKYKLKIA